MSSKYSSAGSVNSSVARMTAELHMLAKIHDLEVFAFTVVANMPKPPSQSVITYSVMSQDKGADMLSWKPSIQIQDINDGFSRLGAIGDGNCLIHSMFTAASPTYRSIGLKNRQKVVDTFRDVLTLHIKALKKIVDIMYPEIGAASLYDSFENLEASEDRSEIDIELAPAIARLYGYNFLAVRINDDLEMLPICQTLYGRDPDLPTLFIHYIGGATNIGGNKNNANFGGQGHYEVIIRPVEEVAGVPESSRRRTTARASTKKVTLDEFRTKYVMTEADLADVLALFADACKDMGEVAAVKLNIASIVEAAELGRSSSRSRRSSSRSSGSMSPGMRAALAAVAAMSLKRSSSGGRTSPGRRSTHKAPRGGAGGP
jgi:hypothetical protein